MLASTLSNVANRTVPVSHAAAFRTIPVIRLQPPTWQYAAGKAAIGPSFQEQIKLKERAPHALPQRPAQVHCRGFLGGSSLATADDGQPLRVAAIGDVVTLHFTCRDSNGKVLQSSREDDCPLTFEVGAGDIIGNKLFQGFDEAVRGLAEGETTEIEASGGEWKAELLFTVPRDHPEMQRLEGKYKNQGGLKDGMIVELANMSLATILEVTDTTVKLDANNMMAGQRLFFHLEVAGLNRVDAQPAKAVPEA